MKEIKLQKLLIRNFKGCNERSIKFGDNTSIYGANATGKTTIVDAFTWLLFNKDSQGTSKFQIRPLDLNGNQIDNVEIVVEATLDIDGKIVILNKTQKQKWVKKRGSDIAELQGNENLYSINEYPKSEKDFNEFVSGIVDEELFKLITNPLTFALMPWKKQREMLMQLVSEVSDIEIAMESDEFSELIPELEFATTEDIRKKYTNAMNTWKKKASEIPARIDEISRCMVDVDVSELELQKNILNEQIEETEKMQFSIGERIELQEKAFKEISRIKAEMRQVSSKAEEELECKRKELGQDKNNATRCLFEITHKIKALELEYEHCARNIHLKEEEKKELQSEWKFEKARVFESFEDVPELSESDLICPTCGRELTETQKNECIANYEERKKKNLEEYMVRKAKFEEYQRKILKEIAEKGNAALEKIKEYKEKLENVEKEMKSAKEEFVRYQNTEGELIKQLIKLPKHPDMSGNQVYESLELELANANTALSNLGNDAGVKNELKIKLMGLREELEVVIKKIASADNSGLEERIKELREEQLDVAQKVADQERMIDLLERFIRTKMERISNIVNNKFNTVSWKLFENQINGGMKECCECTVYGVPYSALNNGHKIVAGLDIISTLCELIGVSAPVFVDNAESINNHNIPNVNSQMILLRVSDDTNLRVEV